VVKGMAISYLIGIVTPNMVTCVIAINKLCMSQTVLLFGATHFLLWRRVSVSSTMHGEARSQA